MFNVVSSSLCYKTLLEIIVFHLTLRSAIIDLKTDVCLWRIR